MDYFRARGGELRLNSRLQSIQLDEEGLVDGFRLTDGTTVRGDLYVSAMPGVQSQDTSLSCCIGSMFELRMHRWREAVSRCISMGMLNTERCCLWYLLIFGS